MAVSPKQLNETFMHEVDVFEANMDEALSKRTITKGGMLSVDVPRGMTNEHFHVLRTRYISAGWSDVKWEFDQREGSWLSFRY
jgi:hypothetical protein